MSFLFLSPNKNRKGKSHMSTSLLYHGFGLVGYQYIRTRYEKGTIIFQVRQDRHDICCPSCQSKRFVFRGKKLRRFRSIPIGSKQIFIEFEVPRIMCLACNVIRQAKVSFAEKRRTFTKSFERYVLELSRVMTIFDISKHLKTSWGMIKDIQNSYLSKRFSRPSLKNIDLIAIDEISIGKGHKYLTVVLNLSTGAVVFVGEGKGTDALKPFWRRIKRIKSKIKAVAIDMSPAYIAAVLENLPKAAIVFDHFHVIKYFNDKLSDFRRSLYNQLAGVHEKQVLKGTRWLLLKNPENLNDEKDESKRLNQALELNKPLATAYYLKEELRQFWKQTDKATAEKYIHQWINTAASTKIPMLQKFAKTVAGHKFGILNFYDHPISTGPLEGTNNKIKTLQKQAYGFRDHEFFKLKIYGLHETKYALVG
jgi:transposase